MQEKNKLVRRAVLAWAMVMVTYVVYKTYQPHIFSSIDTPQENITLAFLALLTAALVFFREG